MLAQVMRAFQGMIADPGRAQQYLSDPLVRPILLQVPCLYWLYWMHRDEQCASLDLWGMFGSAGVLLTRPAGCSETRHDRGHHQLSQRSSTHSRTPMNLCLSRCSHWRVCCGGRCTRCWRPARDTRREAPLLPPTRTPQTRRHPCVSLGLRMLAVWFVPMLRSHAPIDANPQQARQPSFTPRRSGGRDESASYMTEDRAVCMCVCHGLELGGRTERRHCKP